MKPKFISTTYKKTIKKFSLKLWKGFGFEFRITKKIWNPNCPKPKLNEKIGDIYGVKFYQTK